MRAYGKYGLQIVTFLKDNNQLWANTANKRNEMEKKRTKRKSWRVGIITSLLVLISFSFYAFNESDFKFAKSLSIYSTLFQKVNLLYVDEVDPEELMEASIQGMLESLDPYTTYIPESDTDELKFMTTGQYGGIGAMIRKAGDYSMISEPYRGFPAQRAGLRAGDTLVSINGVSTKDKDIAAVSELLKGKPNTDLKLVIRRYGKDEDTVYNFTREKVTIKNVPFYGLLEGSIGYIRLGNFTKGASKEVKSALADLKGQGATSIILDLRGNPGGLLTEAVNISNIFVNKGQEIVSTRGKLKQQDKSYKTQYAAIDTTIPLAVLVSRGSASASEIVAGSLQDVDRAIIIGQKTFGKGLVQSPIPLNYNTHLKITTAKYYIPSGRCIQALDYTHRNEDGSVGYIPDSLISEFKTKNGRKVYDGGGIDPDIKLESKKPGNITFALYAQNLIFDFATIYAAENPEMAPAAEFTVSPELYAEFLEYVKSHEFEYETVSSEKLEELVKIAKREGYYELAKDEIDALEKKLAADKEKDLLAFKIEIKELLQEELVSRYHYQAGRIETSLSTDQEVIKAIETLHNNKLLTSILDGSFIDPSNDVALSK